MNLLGVRSGGRLNDALTIAKLVPLLLLVAVGVTFAVARPELAVHNLVPFAPLRWGGVGSAPRQC